MKALHQGRLTATQVLWKLPLLAWLLDVHVHQLVWAISYTYPGVTEEPPFDTLEDPLNEEEGLQSPDVSASGSIKASQTPLPGPGYDTIHQSLSMQGCARD